MATLCGVVVEDDPDLREILARVLIPSIVGCTNVVACEDIVDLRRARLPEEPLIVLVTDGQLLNSTCADVIEYVLATFGPGRLCGHALLTSANSRDHWTHVFSRARAGGIELSYRQKPMSMSIEDLETWWRAVNANFT